MIKLNTGVGGAAITHAKQQESLNHLKNNKKIDAAGVEKASSGFEALLLHNMLKEMWKTSGTGEGLLGENSHESQLFRDMLNQAIAEEVSKGQGVGVKQFLKKELSELASPASKKNKGL